MARIFISYRRRDSAYVAIDVRDALQARFGMESVFFDIDNIPFGADFRQYIGNAVGQCDVLLVLIGDQWLPSADDQGRRRIDDPADYVRIEIESALKRNIPVVPVLVGEAKVPGASELPESIRDMAFRNAAEIRATRDQKNHIERLVSGLVGYLRTKVSDAKEEKAAAAKEKEPLVSEPREKIVRPKVRQSRKKKLRAKESTVHELAPMTSPVDIEKQANFSEQVRKAFEGVPTDRVWFGGAIPPEKATAATNAYAPNVSQDSIMLLYDNTLWGGAKHGLLLTADAIYWRNVASEAHCISYADITGIRKKRNASDLLINDQEIQTTMGAPLKITHGIIKLIRHLRPELPTAESAAPGSAVSQSDIDRRAAFLAHMGKAFQGITDDKLYFSGAIPPDKADGATNAYASSVSQDAIMLLYDNTVFGGAENGLLLTVDAIYWDKPGHCRYADIKNISVTKDWIRNTKLNINGEETFVSMGQTEKIAHAMVDLARSWKAYLG